MKNAQRMMLFLCLIFAFLLVFDKNDNMSGATQKYFDVL